MNKLISLLFISALMLTACTSETTAELTNETTAATTTVISMEYFETPEDIAPVNYDSYEALMAEYNKGRSGNYVYPLPDIVDTWEFKSASLCQSNYTLYYDDTANGVSVMLEIGFNSSYESISDYLDGLGYGIGVETVEIYDRYAVDHYTEFDSYSITGITGEENIRYTLVVGSDDETKDPIELLKEYKELLEL